MKEAQRHPESWVPVRELGTRVPPYRPTFGFVGFINDHHEVFATCPVRGVCIDLGVPGWLRREDALKLYEMAFFAAGDVLEVGSHHGLSTGILARAVRDAGRGRTVTSVEIDPGCAARTQQHLTAQRVQDVVTVRCAAAEECLPELVRAGRRFGFVFVDHAHTYRAVLDVCRALPGLLVTGGFALFHDFNDGRNLDPDDPEYDVANAVIDGLEDGPFEFYGVYGCAALYRRTGVTA
jgi:predicted O-methyltransferase YrrM